MNQRQKYIMQKAEEKISELRVMLDDVMYHNEPLPDNEYKKIREGYDLICQANDKLF